MRLLLAYLLRVCDELQCWDRPFLVDLLSSSSYLKGDKLVDLLSSSSYLKGDKVWIVETNPQSIHIDDDKEVQKIKDALQNIIDPTINQWLD